MRSWAARLLQWQDLIDNRHTRNYFASVNSYWMELRAVVGFSPAGGGHRQDNHRTSH
jgi:hypothetical protein